METTVGRPQRAVQVVGEFFDTAFAVLERWKPDFAGELAAVTSEGRLTAARLDELVRPYAATTLSEPGIPVYGAGFIAALDLLHDARSHLSWWQGPDREQLSLAWSIVNKEYLDYSEFEWYRVPMITRTAHLSGPSVDYLCSDEYTITVSTPVVIRGRFAGVAALDLLVDSVERRLVPVLRREAGRATLVNSVDRIIASADPCLAPGDLIGRAEAGASHRRHRCGSLSLLLLG